MKTLQLNKIAKVFLWIINAIILFSIPSCKKQDSFLNIKSNKSDVSPTSIKDLQAVLDNTSVMTYYNSIIGLVGTDNVYIPDANLNSLDVISRNAYLWAKDIYAGGLATDWYEDYQMVEYTNIVLDGLTKLSADNSAAYNNVKGSALFYRSFAFYQLSQIYCKPYNSSTAISDLGIPLRVSSDVNIKSVRATVQQTYDQMIADLKAAASLLPQTPLYKTRPSIVTANALLAKIYLAMGDYNDAYHYADLVLKDFNTLLDYNTLKISTSNPFPTFQAGNPEIIYFAMSYGLNAVYSSSAVKGRVAPDLYQSYEAGDLRKTALYTADGATGLYKFKGSYSAMSYNFCGIAADELYLIHAECAARANDLSTALSDLNILLKKRYTPSSFVNYATADQSTLLNKIILERRKEMPFTGNIRWEDLRRLNSDSHFAVTLTRTYNNVLYTLAPNDNRYVYPLPDDEITLDGLQQNPR